MDANLPIIRQFDGEYPPAVGAELDQIIATIQQWANGFSGSGVWVDIDPATVQFSGDGVTTWTVPAGKVLRLAYNVIGTRMEIQFNISFSAITGPPNRLYINMPLPYTVVKPRGDLPKGYLHGAQGSSVNMCSILNDLDTYVTAYTLMNTDKGPMTLCIVPLAAGAVGGGFPSVGAVGTAICEVVPQGAAGA